MFMDNIKKYLLSLPKSKEIKILESGNRTIDILKYIAVDTRLLFTIVINTGKINID